MFQRNNKKPKQGNQHKTFSVTKKILNRKLCGEIIN